MTYEKWTIPLAVTAAIFFTLLAQLCSSIQQFQHQKPDHDDGKDSVKDEALNNFLANVLRAKDELNWIDRTIYSRTSARKLREVSRKLFWSDDSSLGNENTGDYRDENSIELNDGADYNYGNDNNESRQKQQKRLSNQNNIETVIHSLSVNKMNPLDIRSGSGSKNSRSNHNDHNINNGHIVRRHYPIADKARSGVGVIEYYDYEADVGKRDLSNDTPTTTTNSDSVETESISPEEKKKIEDLLKIQEENNLATYKPPREQFLNDDNDKSNSPKSSSPKSKNIAQSPKRQIYESAKTNQIDPIDSNYLNTGMENNVNFDGHQATYNSDRNDSDELVARDSNIPSNYEKSFADNHPTQLPVASSVIDRNNSSSSGSNYHDLKITDDMFKGGMEQDNKINQIPVALLIINNSPDQNQNNRKQSKNPRKNLDLMELSSKSRMGMKKNHDELREMRSRNLKGPITLHESIVEPLNSPWEYYDEKDDIGIQFGRRLMESSLTSNNNSENDLKQFFLNDSIAPKKSQQYKRFIRKNWGYENSKNNATHSLLNSIGKESFNDEEDSSLIHTAVNGKLAKEIVDKIFEQADINEELKLVLRPGPSRKNKTIVELLMSDKPSTLQKKNDTHTDEIMKKVTELLSRIIMEEMEKKTCTKLPSQLHKILRCMVNDEEYLIDTRKSTRPFTMNRKRTSIISEKKNNKYLFSTVPTTIMSHFKLSSVELDEIYRKIRLLKRLIKEYHLLSSKERAKVQVVHDYLERQLNSLINYVKLREKGENNVSGVTEIPDRMEKYSRPTFQDENNFIELPIISEINLKQRKRRRVEEIPGSGDISDEKNNLMKYKRESMANFSNNSDGQTEKIIYPSDLKLISNNSLIDNNNSTMSKKYYLTSECIVMKTRTNDDRLIDGELKKKNNSTIDKLFSPIDQVNIDKNIAKNYPATSSSTLYPLMKSRCNLTTIVNILFKTSNKPIDNTRIIINPIKNNKGRIVNDNTIKKLTTALSSYNCTRIQKMTTEKIITNDKSEFNREQESEREIIERKINVFPVD